MRLRLTIPLILASLTLLLNSALADSALLGYKVIAVSKFPKVEWVIPQTVRSDRIYIRAKFSQGVNQAKLLIDQQTLLHPIGNAKSGSSPAELVSGYQKQYSDLQIFPLSPLKLAKSRIQIGWVLDNGKQKQLIIQGKQLQKILKAFP